MGDTPFVAGSGTSAAAADAIAPSAETLRAKVLQFIVGKGVEGATDDEIQTALGMAGNTERPRRRELEDRKLIGDSQKRRLTASKRQAVVWVAAVHVPSPKVEEPPKPQFKAPKPSPTVAAEIPSFLELFGVPKEDL